MARVASDIQRSHDATAAAAGAVFEQARDGRGLRHPFR